MNIAKGFAVVEYGTIDMRTVYPTRRGAIVNWLVVRGRWVHGELTDDEIEEEWELHSNAHGEVAVHKVLVSVEQ